MTSKETGIQAEQLALRYLEKHNLQLLIQNFSCRRGEIDLIMQDKDTLVFVEVRYRKSAKFGSALESVNYTKQSRIITTAQHYLQQQHTDHASCRFDVIAISPSNHDPEIVWVKDAFQLTQ